MRTVKGHSSTGEWYYTGVFDEKTGSIVRVFKEGYGSPMPETLDISITNKCSFGCSYCYRDSTKQGKHGSIDQVKNTILSFTPRPFQVALGGGEPTGHPDFLRILGMIRKLGVVPNYTTSGNLINNPKNLRVRDIYKVTNEVCGGVALTYHAFKGEEYFIETYEVLRERLTCQLNVHVIADDTCPQVLRRLSELAVDRQWNLTVVLLGFYPERGSKSLHSQAMGYNTYQYELPKAIREADQAGVKVGFSEGMLPFFLSRPELNSSVTYAHRMEGRFSLFADEEGFFWPSSFSRYKVFSGDRAIQEWWVSNYRNLYLYLDGEACGSCVYASRCNYHDATQYMACAFALHNNPKQLLKPRKAEGTGTCLSMTYGFITNSSSVVYFLPANVINDPEFQAILDKYQIRDGYIGSDLQCRDTCSSYLPTEEGLDLFRVGSGDLDFLPTSLGGGALAVYGDEYESLARLLVECADRVGARLQTPPTNLGEYL